MAVVPKGAVRLFWAPTVHVFLLPSVKQRGPSAGEGFWEQMGVSCQMKNSFFIFLDCLSPLGLLLLSRIQEGPCCYRETVVL